MADDTTPNADAKPAEPRQEPAKNVYLVSYPKIVFLYPSFLMGLVAGIYMLVAGDASGAERSDTVFVSLVFLGVLGVNVVVLSFDFPRTTSLTLFFLFAAIIMGLVLMFRLNPDLLGGVSAVFARLTPWANAQFYFLFCGILGLIFIGVQISVQFDYWEVRPNELLHHHGILSDLERFSAPNVRIDKEINDVFEYLLLRAGRLVLHPSNERRAIVLENVFFINKREAEIKQMLAAIRVKFDPEDS